MKKHIITIIALMLTLTVFGQAWKESRAAQYAAEAQKEFRLDEKETAQIKDLWIARMDAFAEVGNKAKSGAINEEERKDASQKVAKTYMQQMSKIMGCKPQEFREFNSKAMEKIQSKS